MNSFNLALLLLSLSASAPDESRYVRFIGNSGFEISDGSATILFDFPYTSGAYGYMTFASAELHERPGSLCLFTHVHSDHFNRESLTDIGCKVAGPSEVLARVSPSQELGGESPWTFGSASVSCIDSEHGDVEHCSYVLSWHEKIIVVAGDIESFGPLLERIPKADLLLLPYWLSAEAPELRQHFPEAKIVLSHQEPGADSPLCEGCDRLEQGGSMAW